VSSSSAGPTWLAEYAYAASQHQLTLTWLHTLSTTSWGAFPA
jgi:hypothetical protein